MGHTILGTLVMVIFTVLIWYGLLHNDIYSKQTDKRKHLLVSAFIAILIGSITFSTNNPLWYFIGMFTSLFIGLLKELADKYLLGGQFDKWDLMADLVGSFVLAPFTLFAIALVLELL